MMQNVIQTLLCTGIHNCNSTVFISSYPLHPPSHYIPPRPICAFNPPSQDSKFQTPIRLHRIHPAGRRAHQSIRLQLGQLAMLFCSRADDQSPITTCSSSANGTDTTPRVMLYSQHIHTRLPEARALRRVDLSFTLSQVEFPNAVLLQQTAVTKVLAALGRHGRRVVALG